MNVPQDSLPLVNVVCMKWGDKYPAVYVNRVFEGVSRFLERPFRFLCFTDDPAGLRDGIERHPLPIEPFEAEIRAAMSGKGRRGAWRKISLFRPGLAGMKGPVLGFDIDVVVTGPLGGLIDFAPGKLCMRRDWRYQRFGQQGGHGSVFLFDPDLHSWVYEEFAADPIGSMRNHKRSEQYYTSMTSLCHGALQYWPDEWICSFKYDAMRAPPVNFFAEPKLPTDCRVMCFHGTPKMEQALNGYQGSLRRRTRPCSWLKTAWAG